MTSAAMQQLCQGDGWGEEGRSRAGRWGLHLSSINTIVLCLSHVASARSPPGVSNSDEVLSTTILNLIPGTNVFIQIHAVFWSY